MSNPLEGRWAPLLKHFDQRIVEATHASVEHPVVELTEHELAMCSSKPLYEGFLEEPEDSIKDIETELARLWSKTLRFGVISLYQRTPITQLRERHLHKYVSISCLVRKVYEVKPNIIESVWDCAKCSMEHHRLNLTKDYFLSEPRECPHCGRKRPGQTSFELDLVKTKYEDVQFLEVQDPPEGMEGRSQPADLECVVRPHLVGMVKAGDRITLNGVVWPVLRPGRSVTDRRMIVYAIERTKAEMDEKLTADDIQKIMQMSRDRDILNKMARSILPDIHGHHTIKVGLLLQLFGGVPVVRGGRLVRRGELNSMLIGDPGTGKSQMIRELCHVHPRGFYSQGGGATSVGLTAAVVKNSKNKDAGFAVEAGTLVLADGGFAGIDELDKLAAEETAKLNEALEHRTVSLAKASINTILNARCAVIAGANPKFSKFDNYQPIPPQIRICDPSTLDRFDVLFLLRDDHNREKDGELAEFMLDQDGGQEGEQPYVREVEVEWIRKYITYARDEYSPKLSDEAKAHLKGVYQDKRELSSFDLGINVGPRQLNAMRMLSQASARARLSDIVTINDAKLAAEIVFNQSIHVGMDDATAKLDLGIITSGNAVSRLNLVQVGFKLCRDLTEMSLDGKFTKTALFQRMREEDSTFKGKEEEILRKLHQRGDVYMTGIGELRLAEDGRHD